MLNCPRNQTMTKQESPDPAKIQQILWGALLGSVSLLGGVIWFLATEVEVAGLPQNILNILLAAGFLSALPYLGVKLVRRGDAGRDRWQPAPGTDESAYEPQKALQRFIIGAALAELPAMFGIVFAALGGKLSWALALWALSLALMLAARPSTTRVI